MDQCGSFNHTKWECKYHVVFIPKWRRKVLYGGIREPFGTLFRALAEQKESRVVEGHRTTCTCCWRSRRSTRFRRSSAT